MIIIYKSFSKIFILAFSFILFSCYKTNVVQYETWNQDPLTKASGYQVNRLQRQYNSFSGARFLSKYDEQCGQILKIITVTFQILNLKDPDQYLYPSLTLIKMFRIVTDGKKRKIFIME